ncbi:MAG: zf-HC2 domain-containing protein [Planctomycetales bacterium]|nr:zf-HC2 domain-containing protein [Planctomycetales bacterium]
MPLDGDKLNELLSGYFDNALSEDERRQVEDALTASQETCQELAFLRNTRESLQALSGSQSGLSSDFTDRVLQQLPSVAVRDRKSKSKPPKRWQLVLGLSALAASLVFIISNPGWFVGQPELPMANVPEEVENSPDLNQPDGKQPFEEPSLLNADSSLASNNLEPLAEPLQLPPPEPSVLDPTRERTLPVRYLSQASPPMFALVLHVRPTQAALDDGVLERTFQGAGIPFVSPIVANADVESAVRDVSMIVDSDPSRWHAALYFVRAEATVMDQALRSVWVDTENFPDAKFNFAIDNPEVRLLGKIASITGERFLINETFAASIASDAGDKPVVARSGIAEPVFVSKSERTVWPGGAALAGPTGGMSPLLLVVHLPE